MHSGRASTAFSVVVLTTLALYVLIGVILLFPQLASGVLGHDTAGHISQHFRGRHHRIHDLTFSLLVGTSALGMLAQLRRPSENAAGQLMSLLPWVALGVAFLLSTSGLPFAPAPIFGALTLFAALLHPTRRDLFRSLRVAQMNRLMVALTIIAALPLLAFAYTNIGLQQRAGDDHAALGHYGFMAAFSFTVIGVGLLASFRPAGWRLVAWVAGSLTALVGLVSLVLPDVQSRLGFGWAVGAMAWGAVFVGVAEFARHAADRTALVSPRHVDTAESDRPGLSTATSGWAYVVGIVCIVLILLFVILHLRGGGIGRHTELQPPAAFRIN